MDELGIIKICDTFQIDYGRVRAPAGSSQSRNMSVSCPLALVRHGDPNDANKSCSIEVVDDGPSRVRCFSGNCKFHGSLLKLVREAVEARGNPQHLRELLQEVAKVESVTLHGKVHRQLKKIHTANNFTPPVRDREVMSEKLFDPYANKIPQYAIDRGITVETAKAWGLGYDAEKGYLVFPVRRRDQALVGLVGRAVSSRAEHTHHNYYGLDKAKHLFGAHMLHYEKPVVIVESCIDALNTWQALEGRASVVASLGEGFSERHALTIAAQRPPFVYIFTDGDGAGRVMGSKIAYVLHQHAVPAKLMECPWGPIIDTTVDGKAVRKKIDPSDLPDWYIRQLFDEARIVRKKIRWSDPPPYFDPAEAA